jgi:phage tail sheath protein FI
MARLDYFAPGVYVEEVDRGSRPIEGVSTAVAGFIGFTEDIRGGAELFKPMLVTTWTQYLKYFAKPNSSGFTDFNAYLPFAVHGYFMNGGGRCYISSIGTRLPQKLPEQSQPVQEELSNALKIPKRGNRPCLNLLLRPEKAAEGSVQVVVSNGTPRALPPASEGDGVEEGTPKKAPRNTGEFFTLQIKREDEVLEKYDYLTMEPEVQTQAATYVVEALRSSNYITIQDIAQPGQPLARRPLNGEYDLYPPIPTYSDDQFAQEVEGDRDERTGVRGIFEIDDITMLAFPDLMRAYEAKLLDLDQVHGIMETMVSRTEGTLDGNIPGANNQMVLLDPPPSLKPQEIVEWLDEFGRHSMYAALYYPWIKVPNPRNAGRPILVPPCGHMMGIWGRTDEKEGVHKAPANEVPRGVIGLGHDVNFREQELLNPLGINCIRKFPNRGIRVWGARTLVEPDITEYRYISVRRLVNYIEKSIQDGTQWAVFEPNDEDLWGRVGRIVYNFLERIWREGALAGSSAQQAFYVKCNAENNTLETMLLGRLYVEIGIAPVRPAEFVVIRVSQLNGLENQDNQE